MQRDEIVQDRFDRLIEHCEVLDLESRPGADEMFAQAADVLSTRLGLSAKTLLEKLRAREAESSTVIQPGLAIPHIVVDGEHRFDILPIRCREGIVFGEGHPPVQTVFILAGSQDERNFHLRALSAIAQIALDRHFEKQWMAARGPQALRDILLLADRKRK